jgi:uncharacterized protein YqeY
MENRIQVDILTAMKSKDENKLRTLRGVKTAIMEYKTSPNFKGDRDSNLPDADVIKLMQKMAKERRDVAKVYADNGRTEMAEKENTEASIIEAYLPQSLTIAEVEELVKVSISELGATSMKDMGRVVKDVVAKSDGRTDGKTVSSIVKNLLS